MVLWALVGKMGGGKTLLMTYFIFINYIEKLNNVYTNYALNFPKRKDGYSPQRINMDWLLDPNNAELFNCSIGLDEIWVEMDSRNASSNINKAMSYILLQSRKRNVDIFMTAQTYMQLDKRVRNNADFIVYCKKAKRPGYIRFTIIPRDNPERGTKEYQIDGTKIYDLYNTNEIIKPKLNMQPTKKEAIPA